jgi:hypothetical protein
MSPSLPDFTQFLDSACPFLPGLQRVDFRMAKVQSEVPTVFRGILD